MLRPCLAVLPFVLTASACGDNSCVAAGSMVDTPQGRRPIEALKIGDEVHCVDPQSGALHVARIVATKSARRPCVMLGVSGEAPLYLTHDHPVYSPEHKSYGDAGHWVSGEVSKLVQVGSDGVQVVAAMVARADGGEHEVYDLTVDHELHNFVANGVLVHNKSETGGCQFDQSCGTDDESSGESGESGEASETASETATGDGDGDGDTEGGDGDGDVTYAYAEIDSEDRDMIDHLWLFTPEAVSELAGNGETPDDFIEGRLDDLNAVLDRSLVTSSRVRSLGYHLLLEEDFARVGAWPGATNDNLGNAQAWLGDYRATYGVDKFLVVAGSTESGDGYNWGGGAGSSYYIDFVALTHEVGHTMGGGHCNDGAAGYDYGMPLAGYDANGTPNPPGLTGGTAMCGNAIPYFSNPDLQFDQAEIADLVADGLLPDQDYAGELGGGPLILGDAQRANMAQTWRDNEEAAALRTLAAKYPGYTDSFYDQDDCAGFYFDEGYQQFAYELCDGDSQTIDAADVAVKSVQLGRNVHVNLYSDDNFGAGSTCGGLLQRLAFSSPSLDALAQHRNVETVGGQTNSVSVFVPTDRAAHARFDGGFEFFSSAALPYCATADGETLTLIRDGDTWTGAAAFDRDTYAAPYTIEFDFRSDHPADDDHADGMVVMFGKNAAAYASAVPPRENLGFIADGSGYGVMFNDWQNQSAIKDGDYADLGTPVSHDSFTDGAWVPVRIEVGTDDVQVFWDGSSLLQAALPAAVSDGRVGVGAGTGAYSAEFSVRGWSVTPG